jgi:hypothetical protein
LHRTRHPLCVGSSCSPHACTQAQRRAEAADARAAEAAGQTAQLAANLATAQDAIVTLEGHVAVLEEDLAKHTQLPQ